jgi:hypothetical protein
MTKMAGPTVKQSKGQNNFNFIFPAFERDKTVLRGTLVENVEKSKLNQPY